MTILYEWASACPWVCQASRLASIELFSINDDTVSRLLSGNISECTLVGNHVDRRVVDMS